tara:strand:- start:1683 stop:1991 length:309 start_codon:yes stop_codon:yes gene_type:complete
MESPIRFNSLDKVNIQVVAQGICPDTFDDTKLPTDVHIIAYQVGKKEYFDAVRAYTMVDIFDAYHDKLQKIGTVTEIKSGYGRIKPKLYGKIKTEEEERSDS